MALNKWIGIGRLTADPELRQTQSGIAVSSITVAVDRPYQKGTDKKADFIPVVVWRQSAEFLNKYFSKGDPIQIEGRIEIRTYEDKDGVTRYVTEVIADNISFVTGAGRKEETTDPFAQVIDNPPAGFEINEQEEDLPFWG